MSRRRQQRDYLGRWLPMKPTRTGLDIMEEIGGCVLLVLFIYTAFLWGF